MAQNYSEFSMLFSAMPELVRGEVHITEDRPVSSLIIDSRKAVASPGAVFFAIAGERNNGHDYLRDVYAQGIRQFVVERTSHEMLSWKDANIFRTDNTVAALQALAAHRRSCFNIPVIGITGSNGKTIVKEWLFQLLSPAEVVVKNPGSYNSQVGVPLSIWQIQRHHTIGIFEAGISRPGEMAKLREMIRPEIGIFTNIGQAHNEGFRDEEQKISEKMILFRDVRHLVCCRDHKHVYEAAQRAGIPTFSWGSTAGDVVIKQLGEKLSVQYRESSFVIQLPFDDHASVENASHVIALLILMGYDHSFIASGIKSLKSVPMRLELKEGINQCHVVDDTYNNDLSGIEISLQFLVNQHQKKKKTVILSDVLQSGLSDHEMVSRVASLLSKHRIDVFIGIGPVFSSIGASYISSGKFFRTVKEFLDSHFASEFSNEMILVKGARVFGFEAITRKLQRKIHGTVMEIDLDALTYNLNLIKSKLSPGVKVMVMVKAFAYGSGSNEVANLLQYHQVDYLGVAYPDEGVELRKNNISLPVMVMNSSEENFDHLLNYDLEPEIYSFGQLEQFIQFLGDRNCKVHIKLDTGMKRLGFEPSEVEALISVLARHPNIKVASVFSHLAGADEEKHDTFSGTQASLFVNGANQLREALGYKPLYHLLNSPGILRFPQYHFDMVRLGIGLYGIDPTASGVHGLRPVTSLKTTISQIKRVRQGESVGYGRRGMADHDMTIATIAIGYADGFSRAFSRGVGKVWINGKLAPVVGNVCMDMTMVDITGIAAAEGDEVVIFGKENPIDQLAKWTNTIPYEILTNTSERVKRVFIAESL